MPGLRVQIVTAEREVLSEDDVDMVLAPGALGELGILPRHALLLATLHPGLVRIKKGVGEEATAVGGGFLQVAHDRVLILADTAERAADVDEALAEQARQRAQDLLAEASRAGEHVRAEAARVAVRRETARLAVVQHHRRHHGPL